jgi:Reverse transcriptase (RNA-dependent DNA polymerase)
VEYTPPLVLVKKKDNSIRVWVDYREVNTLTSTDAHPIPLIENLLNRLGNKSYFLKIDLREAYHQIPLEKEKHIYTAFYCHKGTFRYNVMPFGLKNSPSQF